MKKIDIVLLIVGVFLCLFTLKDLFKPLFFTSHDGQNQILRLYYFDLALKDGQFPPRLAGGLFWGRGYPLYVFSYQMPWIIAEPFYYFSHDVFASVKYAFIVGYILSGFSMYYFLKRSTQSSFGAFVGMIVYLYAPYRFLNIFVRAAAGDATSFIFPPLLFLSIYELSKIKEKRLRLFLKDSFIWIIIGALALSGLILSHAMVMFLFCLFSLIYFVFLLFGVNSKKNFFLGYFFIFILGIGLSAYYFVPSFIERNLTIFGDTFNLIFSGATYLTLKELIYMPWGYGLMHAAEGGMSFQVGFAQWASFILGTILLGIFFLAKKGKRDRVHIFFYIVSFILSLFLMLKESSFVWSLLRPIFAIDFTWRVLPVTVFSASVLSSYVASSKTFLRWTGIFILLVSFYANRNHIRINKIQDWDLPFYINLEDTTNMYDEYTPKWVTKDYVKYPYAKKINTTTEAKVEVLKDKSNEISFLLDSDDSGTAIIESIYYPGWQATVNGKNADISYAKTGLMEIDYPNGKNELHLSFKETFLRKVANGVTILSGIIILWGLYSIKRRSISKKNENKN